METCGPDLAHGSDSSGSVWMNTRQQLHAAPPAFTRDGQTDRREDHRRLTNRDDHSQHSYRQVLAQEEMLAPS